MQKMSSVINNTTTYQTQHSKYLPTFSPQGKNSLISQNSVLCLE